MNIQYNFVHKTAWIRKQCSCMGTFSKWKWKDTGQHAESTPRAEENCAVRDTECTVWWLWQLSHYHFTLYPHYQSDSSWLESHFCVHVHIEYGAVLEMGSCLVIALMRDQTAATQSALYNVRVQSHLQYCTFLGLFMGQCEHATMPFHVSSWNG